MNIKSYEQFLIYAKECKKNYQGFPCSFFDLTPVLEHKRKWKNMVYAIDCKKNLEYKKDVIWQYLQNDISYEEMAKVLERKQ